MRIITIATGSRRYMEFAYNLALTIRASVLNAEIAVITDLTPTAQDRDLIDLFIAPKHANAFQIKANLYGYIPKDWKDALFLDADTVFNHHRHELEEVVKGFKSEAVAFARPMKHGPMPWATAEEVTKHYKIKGDLPLIASQAIWMKRGAEASKLFKKVAAIWGKFKGIKADELYFNAAIALTDTDPGTIDLYYTDGQNDRRGEIWAHPFYSLGWHVSTGQYQDFLLPVVRAAKSLGVPVYFRPAKPTQ